MQTARDLFIHELSDMLDAEQKLVDALAQQEEESERPELKKAFAAHRRQTEHHVERIHQIFEKIGAEPEVSECKGIRGLLDEKEDFAKENPSEDLMDVFNTGAAVKVERYEISAYESLAHLARDMKMNSVVKLLQETLNEENAALKKMQSLGKKIKLDGRAGAREWAEAGEGATDRRFGRMTSAREEEQEERSERQVGVRRRGRRAA